VKDGLQWEKVQWVQQGLFMDQQLMASLLAASSC
jgi:hypothetical protein